MLDVLIWHHQQGGICLCHIKYLHHFDLKEENERVSIQEPTHLLVWVSVEEAHDRLLVVRDVPDLLHGPQPAQTVVGATCGGGGRGTWCQRAGCGHV